MTKEQQKTKKQPHKIRKIKLTSVLLSKQLVFVFVSVQPREWHRGESKNDRVGEHNQRDNVPT